MGVLDELKKEAETVKAKVEQDRSFAEAEKEAIAKKIRPRMQTAYRFLKEMADNLTVVAPDVRADYEVRGFGSLTGMRQDRYRVSTPDNRALNTFTFHFICESEGGVKFQVKGKEASERQRQSMWEHNLRFTSKSLADGSGVFFLETFVPVSLEFVAEPDRGIVRLRVRNLDGLGVSTISYGPDRLDEELLEELGKAILRKSNRFNELSGNTLSEEARKRLRQQLAHDGYKRVSEHKTKNPGLDAEEGPVKRKGLLKGIFGRSSG